MSDGIVVSESQGGYIQDPYLYESGLYESGSVFEAGRRLKGRLKGRLVAVIGS